IHVTDGGYNVANPGVVGLTTPVRPGPIIPSNILPIQIFTLSIRWVSPVTNDVAIADAIDPEKTRQTIAHEVGHALNMADLDVMNQCPLSPAQFTVMVTNYFAQSTTYTCAWSAIPSSYQIGDYLLLKVK